MALVQILDYGPYYFAPGSRTPIVFPNWTGLLNGKGGQLPPGSEPVYLDVDTEDKEVFNSAGFKFDGPAPKPAPGK